MKRSLKYIFANSLFMRLFIVILFAWSYLILSYGNLGLFELINEQHTPILDPLFKYVTHLGGGWFALIVALLLFALKFRWGLIASICFLGSTGITQVLKRWVFNWPRPGAVYSETIDSMNLVEGVDLHMQFSFPSGHTTAAFSVFCLLSLILSKKKYLGFLFCFLAILAGYSRAYLFQHFPNDILFGSLIGTLTSVLVYSWLNDKNFGNWGNKSLFKKNT